MTCWHMQIHPDDAENAEEHAVEALKNGVIGLDFEVWSLTHLQNLPLDQWSEKDFEDIVEESKKNNEGKPGISQSIRKFATEIKEGDIVLVRAGSRPVSLTKVVSPYFFNDKEDGLWFRHRYSVEVLGWYDELIKNHPECEFSPFAMGTLQKLANKEKNTYVAISKWLKVLSC